MTWIDFLIQTKHWPTSLSKYGLFSRPQLLVPLMTYNDNVICSSGPLLWWSVWSSFTTRALVPLYHPGTLLYAAREALLSSYQQEEMCTFRLSKGKSFRKWDVQPSSHRVTISITKMTHLHNCQCVVRFPSGFLRRWAADGLKSSAEVLFLFAQFQRTVQCQEPCMPNIPWPRSFYECFFLLSSSILAPAAPNPKLSKSLSLHVQQESKSPEARHQRHLLKYSSGYASCLLGVALRACCPHSCSLCYQTCPGLQVELPVPTINFRSACNIPQAFILDWQWH